MFRKKQHHYVFAMHPSNPQVQEQLCHFQCHFNTLNSKVQQYQYKCTNSHTFIYKCQNQILKKMKRLENWKTSMHLNANIEQTSSLDTIHLRKKWKSASYMSQSGKKQFKKNSYIQTLSWRTVFSSCAKWHTPVLHENIWNI